MTPLEKAKELIKTYLNMNDGLIQEFIPIPIEAARQCALIAVDEIVKEIQCNEFDFQSNVPMSVYTYWKNVKKEIQKL